MAALVGIEACGQEFDSGQKNGDEEVEKKPGSREHSRSDCDDEIRDNEDGGECESEGGGQRLCGADAEVAGKSKCKEGNEEQDKRDDGGKDGERGGHGLSDSW